MTQPTTTRPAPTPAPASPAKPTAAAGQQPTESPAAPHRRAWAWVTAHPARAAQVTIGIVLAELVVYGVAGSPARFLLANVAFGVGALVAWAWRRARARAVQRAAVRAKTQAGGLARPAGAGVAASTRPGGLSLFDRLRPRSRRPGGGSPGGGAVGAGGRFGGSSTSGGRGLHSRLRDAAGRARGRLAGTARRGGTGGAPSGASRGQTPRGGPGAGGWRGGSGGGLRSLFGRIRPAANRPAGRPRAAATPAGGAPQRRSLLDRVRPRRRTSDTAPAGSATGGDRTSRDRAGAPSDKSWWRRAGDDLRRGWRRGWNGLPLTRPADKPAPKDSTEPAGERRVTGPNTDPAATAKPGGRHAETPQPTAPQPTTPAGRHTPIGRRPAMTIRSQADASLKKFVGNLGTLAPAFTERLTSAKTEAEVVAEYARAATELARQAKEEQVAHRPVEDHAERVAARARSLAKQYEELVAGFQALVGEAEDLPKTAASYHETDLARAEAPRTSMAAERRADVTAAMNDT